MSASAKVKRIGTLLGVAGLVGLGPAVGSAAGQETDAQTSDRAQVRLERALPPGDLDRIRDMSGQLESEGIPPGLIRRKALEGIAKGIPPERIVEAVEDYSRRLREAQGLLGPTGRGRSDGASLAAAAEAIRRGVSPDAVRSVAGEAAGAGAARGGRGLAVPLLVLGDLSEAGVPSEQALDLVREAMRRGTSEQRMLNFSAAVQRRIRTGEDPTTAFDQVRVRATERMRLNPDGSMMPSRGEDGRRPPDASPVPPGSEPPMGSDRKRRGTGSY